jgi:hypothetical protein
MVSFKLLPLYPRRKSLRYALYRGLDGPQSRSGRCRKLILGRTAHPLLYLLSYSGSVFVDTVVTQSEQISRMCKADVRVVKERMFPLSAPTTCNKVDLMVWVGSAFESNSWIEVGLYRQ